ncbi:MAG: hypothetical protein DCC75_07970, partial [Proteobacteria bacterium]
EGRPQPVPDKEFKVLVINSSQELAKEITMQLTLHLPGCSIMYAPTLELAKLILKKRVIDLVVSCPILVDGSISKLQEILKSSKSQPSLVVFGKAEESLAQLFSDADYRLNPSVKSQPPVNQRIKSLGADLRNDLNNPLQEIVALLFVAKNKGNENAPIINQALDAIGKAAKNMAGVVKSIEERLLCAVGNSSS